MVDLGSGFLSVSSQYNEENHAYILVGCEGAEEMVAGAQDTQTMLSPLHPPTVTSLQDVGPFTQSPSSWKVTAIVSLRSLGHHAHDYNEAPVSCAPCWAQHTKS